MDKQKYQYDIKEYFDYLVSLRDSGVTNMMGAGAYLQRHFGLSRYEAKDILLEWFESFKVKA